MSTRENIVIRFLIWVGLTRRKYDGSLHRPIKISPLWMWKTPIIALRLSGPIYVFRNRPGAIKWKKGRLLPIRWGFGIAGLIEFGDRG